MNVPTIPNLSRLSKAHKYSAAGVAAGSAVVLAVTGLSGTAGTASAAQQTPVLAVHGLTPAADTTSGAQQADWTSGEAGQLKSISAQADAARKHAGQDAVNAKKKAAQDAARKTAQADAAKRAEAQQAANRSRPRKAATVETVALTTRGGSTQQIARQMMSSSQFQCFSHIVSHESGWNYRAVNAGSGAYGLVQALPGSKMASAGADWQTNPATQIRWGLSYMDGRYGSPCAAWSFWQAHSWY
jgi:hypothetical protein